MNCEACTKEIKPKDIPAGNAFEFFDNLNKKQVVYHTRCYEKKFIVSKKPLSADFKPKQV